MVTGKRKREDRWYSQARGYCQNCGKEGCVRRRNQWGELILHHVTYEQHVRDEHGDVNDPDNSMTLCEPCHNRHHDGTAWRLPARLLTKANVRFMVRVLGSVNRAAIYLRRRYDVEGR